MATTRIAGKAPAKRKKIGALTYSHAGCANSKSLADQFAERKRASGCGARVIKSGTKYCVYTRSCAPSASKAAKTLRARRTK